MENENKKNFKVVGHTDSLKDPRAKEYMRRNLAFSGKTMELVDENGNKKEIKIVEFNQEKINEFILTRYHKVMVTKEVTEREKLKKGVTFVVNDPILCDENNGAYKYKGKCELVLINEKSGECHTKIFLNKMLEINMIKDEKEKNRQFDLYSTYRKSFIKYKSEDQIVEAIVLESNVSNFLVINREDFKDIAHDRKKPEEVKLHIVTHDNFIEKFAVLDNSRDEILEKIERTCKIKGEEDGEK